VNTIDDRILEADCENGYTRVANLILEALPLVTMNGTQHGICLFIWRRTFGWHRDHDAIPLGGFADACGTNKSYISKQLKDLLNKRIIRRVEFERGKIPVLLLSIIWPPGMAAASIWPGCLATNSGDCINALRKGIWLWLMTGTRERPGPMVTRGDCRFL